MFEITRTLTLLFILIHLNADATMRLEGFMLYSGLSFFQCRKLAKKEVKPKNFANLQRSQGATLQAAKFWQSKQFCFLTIKLS